MTGIRDFITSDNFAELLTDSTEIAKLGVSLDDIGDSFEEFLIDDLSESLINHHSV